MKLKAPPISVQKFKDTLLGFKSPVKMPLQLQNLHTAVEEFVQGVLDSEFQVFILSVPGGASFFKNAYSRRFETCMVMDPIALSKRS